MGLNEVWHDIFRHLNASMDATEAMMDSALDGSSTEVVLRCYRELSKWEARSAGLLTAARSLEANCGCVDPERYSELSQRAAALHSRISTEVFPKVANLV